MTLAQGLTIKIAFGKPFKGLISSSCGIWKPNFVLVRQINCINLQNGGKCHLSSFKSATSERAALTSVTAPLPHISTERCHGRPDLQILITAWKMQGRRWTVTSKVQPKSRLGELTVPRLDWNERLYAQIRDQETLEQQINYNIWPGHAQPKMWYLHEKEMYKKIFYTFHVSIFPKFFQPFPLISWLKSQ